MSAIIDAALHRSRTTLSALLLILITGSYAYWTIPKESDPDISIPIVYVQMKHEGISPEDAQQMLLRPMETELRGIEGVKEMRSTAFEGGASVVLEFDAGFDPASATSDVREKVDLAKPELPTDSDEPTVHEVNFSLFPVLVVTLSGEVSERKLLQTARLVRDELEAIPTVLAAKLTGQRDELVEIIIDPAKLDSYGLDATDVLNRVARSNLLVAAGTLDTGNGRFPIKVPGLYKNMDDILDQPIKVNGDAIVSISDVASVRRTFKDRQTVARLDGRPAIAIEVSKRAGTNIIETIERIKAAVTASSELFPEGVHYTFSQDQSSDIRRMLDDLQNNVLSAILLVMIVIVAALGIRSAGLVGVAIPGSFLLGILALSSLGLTINIVVLFALILAVGMLVDGAIVVTEFADRKLAEGLNPRDAYAAAAKRMSWPIIASTATTLAAFLPLIFWPGIVGEFMKYLPITLVATLSASLLMALVFIPTLGARIGKAQKRDEAANRKLVAAETGELSDIGGLTGLYIRVLRGALRHPGKIIICAFATLIGVQFLYAQAGHGVEFFPDVEPDTAMINVHARGNMSISERTKLVLEVEREILKLDEFRSVYTFVGQIEGGRGGIKLADDVIGSIQLEFKDWRLRRSSEEILADIIERSRVHAGIEVEPFEQEFGPPTGKPVAVQLRAADRDTLIAAVATVRKQFESMDGLKLIEDDRDIPGIEWRLTVDRAQAAKFGADIALIGKYVQLLTKGLKITEFRPNDSDEEVDAVVRYPTAYRKLDQMLRLQVQTSVGLVPISSFVSWEPAAKVGTIKRVDAHQAMTVKADVLPGVLADAKARELRAWLETNPLPASVSYVFKGEDEEQRKAQAFLGKAFGVALFIMALILVTQFNSFYSAFLILSAVIMSTIGVLIGLILTGSPFGIVMSGIGVIALAGIVVNNNIVLIDTFDRLKARSNNVADAILRTGAQRLRPVMLTTVTTILGLTPMAMQANIDFFSRQVTIGAPSTQIWVQLSTAIVFGLGFATVLTLIVTPSALMFRENLAAAAARRRRKRSLRHAIITGVVSLNEIDTALNEGWVTSDQIAEWSEGAAHPVTTPSLAEGAGAKVTIAAD
ncbi:MAG: efflux RND transporter permease subunit [Rhodospirillaceae bacterium]|nr:efflux RND transporter permease subunit [Rhodospirillaceae bacterium]